MPLDIPLPKLKAISRDVSSGLTLVKALAKHGLGDQYHGVRSLMVTAGLRTRPDDAASYTLRWPASDRAKACAALWNDGMTINKIAADQGVSKQCVSNALHSADRHGLLTRPTGKAKAGDVLANTRPRGVGVLARQPSAARHAQQAKQDRVRAFKEGD